MRNAKTFADIGASVALQDVIAADPLASMLRVDPDDVRVGTIPRDSRKAQVGSSPSQTSTHAHTHFVLLLLFFFPSRDFHGGVAPALIVGVGWLLQAALPQSLEVAPIGLLAREALRFYQDDWHAVARKVTLSPSPFSFCRTAHTLHASRAHVAPIL